MRRLRVKLSIAFTLGTRLGVLAKIFLKHLKLGTIFNQTGARLLQLIHQQLLLLFCLFLQVRQVSDALLDAGVIMVPQIGDRLLMPLNLVRQLLTLLYQIEHFFVYLRQATIKTDQRVTQFFQRVVLLTEQRKLVDHVVYLLTLQRQLITATTYAHDWRHLVD